MVFDFVIAPSSVPKPGFSPFAIVLLEINSHNLLAVYIMVLAVRPVLVLCWITLEAHACWKEQYLNRKTV